MEQTHGLTRGEIAQKLGCPYYYIDYLRRLGKLPLLKRPAGKGDPAIFHPMAVEIMEEYLRKRGHKFNAGNVS